MAIIANNPANLEEQGQGFAGQTGRSYDDGKFFGSVKEGGRFIEFDSPEMGLRAIFRDLRTKLNSKELGYGDVDKIISKFAPKNENETAIYSARIKKAIGSNKLTNKNLMAAVKEMVAIESDDKEEMIEYYLGDPNIINAAEKLSYINMPSSVTGKDAIKLSIMDVPIGTKYKDALKVYNQGEYPRKTGGRIMNLTKQNYNTQRFI